MKTPILIAGLCLALAACATTGRLSSCDRKPRRKVPKSRISMPENNDRLAASAMYCGLPGVAKGLSTVKVMMC